MTRPPPSRPHALPGVRVLAVLISAAGAMLIGALGAHLLLGADLEELVNDPMASAGGHPLTGILSHVGVLAWWAGAAICLFAWFLVRHRGEEREMTRFLLWGGVITAYLAIDDLFMLHEDLIRRHTPLPQPLAIGLLALVVAMYLWHFRRSVVASEWLLLAAAVVAFGASLGIDFLSDLGEYLGAWQTPAAATFIEDWFKLSGVFAWTAYYVRQAAKAVDVEGPPARSHPGAG